MTSVLESEIQGVIRKGGDVGYKITKSEDMKYRGQKMWDLGKKKRLIWENEHPVSPDPFMLFISL